MTIRALVLTMFTSLALFANEALLRTAEAENDEKIKNLMIEISQTDNKTKTAKLYFKLGDMLASRKRHQESIRFYEISLEHGFPKPYLIDYNIACVYAIQNLPEKAIEYIQKAIANGYSNVQHIRSDADMANLRNDPKFADRLEAILASVRPSYAVLIPRTTPGDFSDPVLLCPSGIFLRLASTDCTPGFIRGHWHLAGKTVMLSAKETCVAISNSTARDTDCTAKYQFKACQQGLQPKIQSIPDSYAEIQQTYEKALPKACNPDWKPKALNDLRIGISGH